MKRKWYEIKAQDGADNAEVFIYDNIGASFFEDGVTAADFVDDLAAITAPKIDVRINSRGGSVFDGAAIYNAIKRHPADITTHIDGAALSIASVIAEAGKKVVMAPTSWLMVHNPEGGADGQANVLRSVADALDNVTETIRNVYEAKTGMTAEDIKAAMDAETWYTAQAALEAGFVDEISDGSEAKGPDPAQLFDMVALGGFHNVPRELIDIVNAATTFSDLPAAKRNVTSEGRVLSAATVEELSGINEDLEAVIDSAEAVNERIENLLATDPTWSDDNDDDQDAGDGEGNDGPAPDGSPLLPGDTGPTIDDEVFERMAMMPHRPPDEGAN
jgi:ATP-dependent Clp endopeptidase proteolytic subunit ClpP